MIKLFVKLYNKTLYFFDTILLSIWEDHLIPDDKWGYKEKDIIGKIARFFMQTLWDFTFTLNRIVCHLIGCDIDWDWDTPDNGYCLRCARHEDKVIEEEQSIIYKIHYSRYQTFDILDNFFEYITKKLSKIYLSEEYKQ